MMKTVKNEGHSDSRDSDGQLPCIWPVVLLMRKRNTKSVLRLLVVCINPWHVPSNKRSAEMNILIHTHTHCLGPWLEPHFYTPKSNKSSGRYTFYTHTYTYMHASINTCTYTWTGVRGEIKETLKAGERVFETAKTHIVGNNAMAADAARETAHALGYDTRVHTVTMRGDTAHAAAEVRAALVSFVSGRVCVCVCVRACMFVCIYTTCMHKHARNPLAHGLVYNNTVCVVACSAYLMCIHVCMCLRICRQDKTSSHCASCRMYASMYASMYVCTHVCRPMHRLRCPASRHAP
jgi:hypothetical protein